MGQQQQQNQNRIKIITRENERCIITVLFRLIYFNNLERLGLLFCIWVSVEVALLPLLALLLMLRLCQISDRPGPIFLFGFGSSCTHRLLSDLKCLLIRTPNIIIPSRKKFEWVSFFVSFVCFDEDLCHLSGLVSYSSFAAFAQSLIPHHVQVSNRFRPFQVTAILK